MAKKFILFFSSIIIITFSFLMPKVLLQLEDLSREKEVFAIPKKESKIDVQAEKIYLVRAIHDIFELKDKNLYDSKSKKIAVSVTMIEHSENRTITDEVKNEIQKIVQNDIIKELNYDDFFEYGEISRIFNSDYTVRDCTLVGEDEGIGMGIEKKTGKIISLDFPNSRLRTDVDKRKQLENYVKYLDLDIIDDWVYENEVLKSEKAQLFIILEERHDVCILTIAPEEVYEEYETIKNEYELVETTINSKEVESKN